MLETGSPTDQAAREHRLVELVDGRGTSAGAASVHDAHSGAGLLHRACSVMLVDGRDRVLLQRRAASKVRYPLLWSNTVCGHPAPGGSVAAAARDRLHEELGVRAPIELEEAGTFQYRAHDDGSGHVEWEHDHVLVGRVDRLDLRPDRSEVAEVGWWRPEDLRRELGGPGAARFTPWLGAVLTVTTALLRR